MSLNARFFTLVTSRVVLCVPLGEVGQPQVEEVLARLTSWQVAALERHMKVTLLASGRLVLREGGLAVHHPARPPTTTQVTTYVHVTTDDVWSVFAVDRASSASGPSVHVYAALNVGREGWCVLTADFHTLLHVLHEHGMEAAHLAGQEEACREGCEGRRNTLVPRARASLRPYVRVTSRALAQKFRDDARKARQIAFQFASEITPLSTLSECSLAYYCTVCHPEAGWVLVAGFDVRARKHRAAGRTGVAERAVEVVCEEGDERGFLCGVGPLVRRCGEASRNTFLRHFTQINPMSWEEAAAAVDGEGGLRAAAFRQVCGLPLQYLRQHAPQHLYSAISLSRTLVPWVPEDDLKAPEDIT